MSGDRSAFGGLGLSGATSPKGSPNHRSAVQNDSPTSPKTSIALLPQFSERMGPLMEFKSRIVKHVRPTTSGPPYMLELVFPSGSDFTMNDLIDAISRIVPDPSSIALVGPGARGTRVGIHKFDDYTAVVCRDKLKVKDCLGQIECDYEAASRLQFTNVPIQLLGDCNESLVSFLSCCGELIAHRVERTSHGVATRVVYALYKRVTIALKSLRKIPTSEVEVAFLDSYDPVFFDPVESVEALGKSGKERSF